MNSQHSFAALLIPFLVNFALLASTPEVECARIIDYGTHHNDTRIDWEDALPIGPPYEPSLYFWWGDEEYDIEALDLLSMNSGVPVTGPGSLWPTRGTPVSSVMAVTNGPLKVPLWVAQEALEKGTWDPEGQSVSLRLNDQDEDLLRVRDELRKREQLRRDLSLRRGSGAGGSGAGGGKVLLKPATVNVKFLSATHDELLFPAFLQEALGDVVSKIVRANPRTSGCMMLLARRQAQQGRYAPVTDAGYSDDSTANGPTGGFTGRDDESAVLGLPRHMNGLLLNVSLAEAGYDDGDEVTVVGVWPHESRFPAHHTVRHALEAFLSARPWPPCANFAGEEPLNRHPIGHSPDTQGVGAEEDNQPAHIIVVAASETERVCYNKHALAAYLDKHDTEPVTRGFGRAVTGQKAERLFKLQVKASLLMDSPYMTVYLSEARYHAANTPAAAPLQPAHLDYAAY